VVALPVAVLAADDVEFSPALPAAKVDAFKAVQPVVVTKVLMEFARPVIPEDADDIVEAGRPWYLWNASKGMPGYSGQVFDMGAEGDEARRLLAMPPERRHGEVLDVIRGIAGDRGLEPVKVIEHEWAKDPFARAAFSEEDAPGAEVIYEPDNGTLFWAGVHHRSGRLFSRQRQGDRRRTAQSAGFDRQTREVDSMRTAPEVGANLAGQFRISALRLLRRLRSEHTPDTPSGVQFSALVCLSRHGGLTPPRAGNPRGDPEINSHQADRRIGDRRSHLPAGRSEGSPPTDS